MTPGRAIKIRAAVTYNFTYVDGYISCKQNLSALSCLRLFYLQMHRTPPVLAHRWKSIPGCHPRTAVDSPCFCLQLLTCTVVILQGHWWITVKIWRSAVKQHPAAWVYRPWPNCWWGREDIHCGKRLYERLGERPQNSFLDNPHDVEDFPPTE